MEDHIKKLLDFQSEHILSRIDMAREMDIAYNTYVRVMDPDRTEPLSLKTLRKVKAFIDKHKVKTNDV